MEDVKMEHQIDDDEEYLDLDRAGTKVWLVKIPKFVAEQWNSIEQPGVELGRLRIHKNAPPGAPPVVSLVLPDIDLPDQVPIPKRYNVTMTNLAPRNQYIFTESSIGEAVEVGDLDSYFCFR